MFPSTTVAGPIQLNGDGTSYRSYEALAIREVAEAVANLVSLPVTLRSGEVITQIDIGIEAGFINKETGMRWVSEAKEINAMLGALIKRHRNKQQV